MFYLGISICALAGHSITRIITKTIQIADRMGSVRSATFHSCQPPKMAFFGLRFGPEVTRNTDERLIHGFCFDNFQSNCVTKAKKGFFYPTSSFRGRTRPPT